MIEDLFGAVSFMTILGRGASPKPSSRYWFALAGVIVAAVAGFAWELVWRLSAPLLTGGIVVLIIVVMTGALHLDGLADAADGLLAHLELKKRLSVMSGPEVGTFGIVAVVMTLMLMSFSLSSVAPNVVLLIGIMSLSRELVALVMEFFPYAKESGIVTEFNRVSRSSQGPKLILFLEAIASSSLVVASIGPKGLVIPLVMCAAQLIISLRAKALIGGYTGDVLGASIVVTETLALVAGALMGR